MAKRGVIEPTAEELADGEAFDLISEEDERQAEAGTLFSIQGDRFANVQWSIHRYRTRLEMQDDSSGEKTEWVRDITGELRGEDLVSLIGGGTFRFYGYVSRPGYNGMKLAFNRLIRLAGPRKDFAAAPPPVASLPVAIVTESDKRMDRLERMIELLITRPQPAPPTTSMTDMIDGVAKLNGMLPRGGGNPDTAMVQTMLELVDKGMEQGMRLAQGRDGDEGGAATMLKFAEILGPVVERLLDARRRVVVPGARPAPGGPPPPGATATGPPPPQHTPTEPSHAQVVDDGEAQILSARMMVLVDELARAIRDNEPADETAAAVEILTPPADLAGILALPPEVVIEDLVRQAGGRYEILGTVAGRAYLATVLAELKREDDPQTPA